MTKVAERLGGKYRQAQAAIRTKSFELGGHTFKARIPLVAESDEIFKRVANPPDESIEKVFAEMTAPLRQFPEAEALVITEGDVTVEGRSMRDAAKMRVGMEIRITEMIKLLVPESPEHSLDDLTYQDIEDEFPLSVQLALVEKISEVISPTYKESRGN
jgi:hypothetical protein